MLAIKLVLVDHVAALLAYGLDVSRISRRGRKAWQVAVLCTAEKHPRLETPSTKGYCFCWPRPRITFEHEDQRILPMVLASWEGTSDNKHEDFSQQRNQKRRMI